MESFERIENQYHSFIAFDNSSFGTRAILATLPTPSKIPSAAYPASFPYFAPTTFAVPFDAPLPISYTAFTTPS